MAGGPAFWRRDASVVHARIDLDVHAAIVRGVHPPIYLAVNAPVEVVIHARVIASGDTATAIGFPDVAVGIVPASKRTVGPVVARQPPRIIRCERCRLERRIGIGLASPRVRRRSTGKN